MSTLVNIPSELSNSFESLPNENVILRSENEDENCTADEDQIIIPLISDSSPVLIVTASYDHTIRFWDVLQGTCIATLQHNESVIHTLFIKFSFYIFAL